MRPVLVLPEDLVLHFEGHIALGGEPPLYLVSRPALRARLARRKARAITGDPEDPEAYRRALGRDIEVGVNLEVLMAEVARHYLQRALEQTKGNKTQAAGLLGFKSYQTLTNWLGRYGVEA